MSNNGDYYHDSDKVINCEGLNMCNNLDQVTKDISAGETLILDIGNNFFNQADDIYDSLVTKGYEVRKTFRNGRNQLIVHNSMK